MRITEFWKRMEAALGPVYARTWAREYVIAGLEHKTVEQALAEGESAKDVWREVWRVLDLPPADR
jgi:hypothetical protein